MNMNKILVPFTEEQVKRLNEYQQSGIFHPFTCCSPENIPECTRAVHEVDGKVVGGTSDGLLIATTEGWICPCGKYKQNWTWGWMTELKFKVTDYE